MEKKIAVFASGNGSNAENLIRYFNVEHRAAGSVALVVCNRQQAGVIARAGKYGVPVQVLTRQQISDPGVMLPLLRQHGIDMIVLAGFLLMVPDFLVEAYRNRIVNIHPSLLPKYGGRSMYGANVHKAVVEAGERVSGITVHYVNEECDGGRIIFQATTELLPTDTAEDLERKIHLLEQEHFPGVVAEVLHTGEAGL